MPLLFLRLFQCILFSSTLFCVYPMMDFQNPNEKFSPLIHLLKFVPVFGKHTILFDRHLGRIGIGEFTVNQNIANHFPEYPVPKINPLVAFQVKFFRHIYHNDVFTIQFHHFGRQAVERTQFLWIIGIGYNAVQNPLYSILIHAGYRVRHLQHPAASGRPAGSEKHIPFLLRA